MSGHDAGDEVVLTAEFEGELYLWEARPEAWTFVALPPDLSDDVDAALTVPPRGFGAVRVEVAIGTTTWRTSVFPDKGRGAYVLPVKRAVLRAQQVEAGDVVTVRLAVRG